LWNQELRCSPGLPTVGPRTAIARPALLQQAAKLTGVSEKTSLVRMGLEALIAAASARRLADLGGSEPKLRPIPRRRSGRAA